jgi:hypothetical protein
LTASKVPSVIFTVTSVSHSTLVYNSADNDTGTSVTISKP